MPHRSLFVLLVAAVATLNVTGAAQGQTPAPPPLTYERVITTTWKNLHDKILQMAKDTMFPDDKLEWRPHPDARSVLEEFRQVTNGLEWSSAQLRGKKLDGPTVSARRNADAGKPKTRASIVSEMEAAIAVSYPLVEKSPTPLLIGWIRDELPRPRHRSSGQPQARAAVSRRAPIVLQQSLARPGSEKSPRLLSSAKPAILTS